ncbi:hypothetical protein C8F04DRAFT_1184841 [Mycena alexandri]|uniref:Uncharacterized protein n=1 Tax=Mycena alexandri TaxID=1745969 RepID=A0AAD6X5A3_9AGAR|nr:hypothetical protein C8F04DRAFT_1184841 [Mycena alexandri]
MAIAATPALLRDLEILKNANDAASSLLGKFEAWPVGQTQPEAISFSDLSAKHIQALGPFDEYSIPSGCFQGTQPNYTTNIMHDILQSQHEAAMKRVTVSANFLQGVQDSLEKEKVHSLTYNKSVRSLWRIMARADQTRLSQQEMTRRTAVDTILSAAVSLAETQWDFAVLNAEEHNFSTVRNNGVTFFNPEDDKTYLLTGPIDYIVTGLDSKVFAQKLANARPPTVALTSAHVQTAIQGTNNTVCPIEAKASITGTMKAATFRQVVGESLVVCQARYHNLVTPLPFILSDGVNWKFGIRSKNRIFSTTLVWGTDDEAILAALVIWTCSQGQKIWDVMVQSLTLPSNVLYTNTTVGVE